AALVDVRDLHAVADAEGPPVRLLLADDHPEQRGLARAVGADHADDAPAGKVEREVVHQRAVAVSLGQMLGAHYEVAEARRWRDRDLRRVGATLLLLGEQLLVR